MHFETQFSWILMWFYINTIGSFRVDFSKIVSIVFDLFRYLLGWAHSSRRAPVYGLFHREWSRRSRHPPSAFLGAPIPRGPSTVNLTRINNISQTCLMPQKYNSVNEYKFIEHFLRVVHGLPSICMYSEGNWNSGREGHWQNIKY